MNLAGHPMKRLLLLVLWGVVKMVGWLAYALMAVAFALGFCVCWAEARLEQCDDNDIHGWRGK